MTNKKSTGVNLESASTHILTRKRQTLVAALGVAIGVGIFLFMNSINSGFSKFSRDEIFKNSAHIKVYKNDEISRPIAGRADSSQVTVIVNPQITTLTKTIVNPQALLDRIKGESYITAAIALINVDVFYNRGKAQVRGSSCGVNILEYDGMFNTRKYIAAGSLRALQGNTNGIIIGKGIAEKLSLGLDDNITVLSSYGVTKVTRIVGILSTGNTMTDDAKSYVNISTAQQFLKEGPSYVTAIYANTPDPDRSGEYARQLQSLTAYTVEDWKTTNADVLAGDKTRTTMMGAISASILLVAAFGIYNILNMTVTQKINDIAILKAIGFSGGDVVKIFVSEAIIMGAIGTFIGLCFGSVLITIMAHIYMGDPWGSFPSHLNSANS